MSHTGGTRDKVKVDGVVIESWTDGFAQDNYGNVWYFGEIVYDLGNGLLVSIDATWTVDIGAAKAEIASKAMPLVGETYCRECALSVIPDPV